MCPCATGENTYIARSRVTLNACNFRRCLTCLYTPSATEPKNYCCHTPHLITRGGEEASVKLCVAQVSWTSPSTKKHRSRKVQVLRYVHREQTTANQPGVFFKAFEIVYELAYHQLTTTSRTTCTSLLGFIFCDANRGMENTTQRALPPEHASEQPTHVYVKVRDGFRNGLDLGTAEVPKLPRHRGVRNGLLVHIVLRGLHGVRLSQVQPHHLLRSTTHTDETDKSSFNFLPLRCWHTLLFVAESLGF